MEVEMRHAAMMAMFLMACGDDTGGGSDVDAILALTGDATAGEAIYADNCAGCHAADGSGGTGPNLKGEDDLEEAVAVILSGEDSMPAFGDTLTDQEIADLVAWLDANVFGS
jgi:mono/diheme cytochrome c family protein